MCVISDQPELSSIEMMVLEHAATIANLEVAPGPGQVRDRCA